MLFHQKTKDLTEDPYKEFQVLCGIEEEFLIINEEGNLTEVANDLMIKSAEILDGDPNFLNSLQVRIRSLDAEPSPSQIEYVTLPLPPTFLQEAVIYGRRLLNEAASKLGVKILSSSLHPLQSNPNPIAGTHINVSVQRKGSLMKPEEMRAVYNYLWNYLPEIIAISGNSPIYRGSSNNISSNRCSNSSVLKPNGFAELQIPENRPSLVPMRYYGRDRYKLKIGFEKDEFSNKVIANNRGDRLVDIAARGPFTNISDDHDELPSRNRVEVRIVDVQNEIEDLLDLAYLCCASALHAVFLHLSGEITQDAFHKFNTENAIANGYKTILQRNNGIREPLEKSVSRWVKETSKYLNYLGLSIFNLPTKKLQTELLQKPLDIEYQSRKLEKLRQQGRTYAVMELRNPRIVTDRNGRQYKIKAGAQIRGRIIAGHKFSYNEKDGMVTNFKVIKVVNYLDVQNLMIPLAENDRVLRVQSESESLIDRLVRGFF